MLSICTERLTIHETDSDTVKPIQLKNAAFHEASPLATLSDDEIRRLFPDKDAITSFFSKLHSYMFNVERRIYGVWLDSTLIGYIGLKDHTDAIPEIQIEFAPEYHRQGYGYEALCKMIDQFFAMGYQCLRYVVVPANKASVALVEKVGGQLQQPNTEIERVLFRTYFIHSH